MMENITTRSQPAPKVKTYLDYSQEEKMAFIKSIRAKKEGEVLTREEQAFLESERKFNDGEDQPYRH